uniref:dystroglycan 1-like n=1 Tax=Myxine glutinosa TaxID=7769 RepID=UPI00358F20CC
MFVRAGLLLLLLHVLPNPQVYVAAGFEQLEPSRRLDVPSDVEEITTAADWGFRLAVDRMKIQEATILPSWLKLDEDLGVLLGHPRENDIGVHSIPLEMNGGYGKPVLFIRVVPEDSAMSSGHSVACPVGEAVTSLTVIVDVDLDDMSGEQRIQLLQHVMPFSGVELRNIKLSPVQNNRLFDTSAFLAGPGNARRMEYVGALLSWQLGCALDIASLPSLAVQQPAKEGKMATALEYPVLGWHVANHKPHRPKKIKRQVFVTPTPIIAAIPPTKTRQLEEPLARVIPSQISPSFLATTSVAFYSAADAWSASQQLLPTTTLPTTAWPSLLHAGPDMPSKPSAGFDVISPMPKFPTKTVVTEELEKKHESSSAADRTPEPPVPGFTETMVTPYDSVEWPVLGGNRPPQLHIPIGYLNVHVGTYFEHRIPLNTFIDSEDGLLDRLRLKLSSKDGIDGSGPWMGLDHSKIMLYGLPPNNKTAIGKHKFVLTATNKAGASSESTFKVVVHSPPHGSHPSVLFETKLNNNFKNFSRDLDLKVRFVKKLTAALGGKNASVLTIEDIKRGSVVVTWSNNTLPLEPCPLLEVHRLCDQMISEGGAPRESFHASMKPEFDVVKVKAYGTEKCADSDFRAVGHRDIPLSTVGVPTTVVSVAHPEAMPAQDRNILYIIIPLILVALLLLLIGACLCYRHKRKGKMTLEERHSFVRKGVPVIFSDEMDDGKPSLSSNKPVILHEEKAPLSSFRVPSYALQECLPPPRFDGHAESRKRHQKGTSMKLVTTTYVPP